MKPCRTWLRSFRYELYQVLGGNFLVLVLLAVVVAFSLCVSVGRLEAALGLDLPSLRARGFSAGDVLVLAMWGMEPFDPASRRFFELDMVWAAPYLLFGYAACAVLSENSRKLAFQVVPRVKSRGSWIASKLACEAVLSLFFIGLELLMAFVFGIAFGAVPSFRPVAVVGICVELPSLLELAGILALVALAFSFLMMLLSLLFGRVVAYGAGVCLVVCSAYFDIPFLFMGGAMTARSGLGSGDWSYVAECAVAGIVILAASIVWALLKSRKVELL